MTGEAPGDRGRLEHGRREEGGAREDLGPRREPGRLPPMLVQYRDYKERNPDCLVLFQVGDFYEVFFDDARTVASCLNLTLTSRDKQSDAPVPMCGVPVAVADGYVERLVDKGYSVAVVSQQGEAPPPGKGMVKRALDRIVTPGVRLLGRGGGSSVAAVHAVSDETFSVAFSDVQSGVAWVREGVAAENLLRELSLARPAEIVARQGGGTGRRGDGRVGWARAASERLAVTVKWRGDSYTSHTGYDELPGMSLLTPDGRRACRLLFGYVEETTVDVARSFSRVSAKSYEGVTDIDPVTARNLELIRPLREGQDAGTLAAAVDRTVTPGGGRLLRERLVGPSSDPHEIRRRLAAVRRAVEAREVRERIRSLLRSAPDLGRLAARVALGAAGPAELGALRDFLAVLPELRDAALTLAAGADYYAAVAERLGDHRRLHGSLSRFLTDSPPHGPAAGGIVRDGHDAEVDRLRALRSTGKSWIVEFEGAERARTGVGSLKIKFNNVLGYFIEVPSSQAPKMPAEYVRRQSTANAERFTLPALKETEAHVLGAEGRQYARERELFVTFRHGLAPEVPALRAAAEAVSLLDLAAAFASLAEEEGYAEPVVRDDDALVVRGGKHPVLAARRGAAFVPNDLSTGGGSPKCLVLTGPNMGGKSTYLRQTALLVVLAQAGSFVPAESAELGVVDKVFARVGASDDVLEGESTFMVEMREAAAIVGRATDRSLVLVDELGRGTTTGDGLALARAVLEWIVAENRATVLFATHFHELTALAGTRPGEVANVSVGSLEREGEIVFTHSIVPGPAGRSYGLEVARRAGLPAALLAHARRLVASAETAEPRPGAGRSAAGQYPLFVPAPPLSAPPAPADPLAGAKARLYDAVAAIDPDATTPKDALLHLYRLKAEQAEPETPARAGSSRAGPSRAGPARSAVRT